MGMPTAASEQPTGTPAPPEPSPAALHNAARLRSLLGYTLDMPEFPPVMMDSLSDPDTGASSYPDTSIDALWGSC